MPLFIVRICDKETWKEQDIWEAVVQCPDEATALVFAQPAVEKLQHNGRGRVYAHATEVEVEKWYFTRLIPPG